MWNKKVQGVSRGLLAAYGLLFALVITVACGPAAAVQQSPLVMQLVAQVPASVWASVRRAEGVVVGARPGAALRVQIVFDPDCPYCALLYQFMRRDHPDIAVRWVPIAYLLRDSGARAGAILASPDPVSSLSRDFTQYDFNGLGSHGGYPIPKGESYTLPAANAELQRDWAYDWGGATPTVLIRNSDGSITRVLGFQQNDIDRLLRGGASGLPAYRN